MDRRPPKTSSRFVSRRRFIAGASATMLTGSLTGCGRPDSVADTGPGGIPISPFSSASTGMEVVDGIDLSNRVALITGCNSGIGLETARVLSSRGATIIGAARTLEKAETTCAGLDGPAIPVVCELSDLDSIAACGETVNRLNKPIDMLILNAGIMALPKLEQIDGIEKQFFVNHIGHFALTSHVIDQVIAAPQGRVVVVSSKAYRSAPRDGIEFDNLSGERDYTDWRMYGTSKLANGLFSLELSKRLAGSNATSNSLHPGVVHTNLSRHFDWGQRLYNNLTGWAFMRSVEEGAATQCYVAAEPGLAGYSGYYFADCNPVIPDDRMLNEQQAAELWRVSEEIIAGRAPLMLS